MSDIGQVTVRIGGGPLKPRIRPAFKGLWSCGSKDDFAIGLGNTPLSAYREWCAHRAELIKNRLFNV